MHMEIPPLLPTIAIVSDKLHPHALTLWGYLPDEAVPHDINVALPGGIIKFQVKAAE